MLSGFFHAWVVFMLLLGVVSDASAQQPQAPGRRNAAYVELLGNGGLYSFNYERAVRAVRLRIGIASWTAEDLFGGDAYPDRGFLPSAGISFGARLDSCPHTSGTGR